jgi:hypothetical protein
MCVSPTDEQLKGFRWPAKWISVRLRLKGFASRQMTDDMFLTPQFLSGPGIRTSNIVGHLTGSYQ